MKMSLLFKWIVMAYNHGLFFTLVGDPGIGKTTVIRDVAKFLGVMLIEIHPAEWDTIDIKGFPQFIPYGEMAEILNSEKQIILLFDDLLHGKPDVLKAIMQVFRGRLGEKIIPSNVFVCGATNDVTDAADVRGMIEPLKSSMILINVNHDPDATLAYAEEKQWRNDLQAFLACNQEWIHKPLPSKQLKKSPCPREWERANNALNALDAEVENDFISKQEKIGMQFDTLKGCVGEDAAKLANGQLEKMALLPKPLEALAAAETIPLPDFNTEQSVLYMLCVAVANLFDKDENKTPNKREKAFKLVERMPQVFQRLLITLLYQRDAAFKTMPQANTYRQYFHDLEVNTI
jgi:hypothetical protein